MISLSYPISFGLIALEIIVGSELVLLLQTYEAVEALMLDIRHHTSIPTHQLLTELLFQVRDRDLLVNAKGDHFETIYKIEDAIASLEWARRGNALVLKKRLETFHAHANAHADELLEAYQWSDEHEGHF